jgi:hypothetical protein
MSYKRILIEEKEKQEILSKYYPQNKVVSEQFDKTKGTYTLTRDHVVDRRAGEFYEPKQYTLPKGSKVYRDFKNNNPENGVFFSEVKKGERKIYNEAIMYCDKDEFYIEDKQYHENITPGSNGLMSFLKKTFCNGTTIKPWEDLTDKTITDDKVKIPKDKYCMLGGDSKWFYGRVGSDWYATKRDLINWIKLDPIKYASAIEKLELGATRSDGSPCTPTLG